MKNRRGLVYLVGAGPGDPGLITVRGMAALQSADVILYDRLASFELLGRLKAGATLIDVGKQPNRRGPSQQDINELMVRRARDGRTVIRLKGGDPFVFGRGFEEVAACREAGVPCIVIPGITSALAGPAAAGIPLTNREEARSFAVVTARTTGDSSAELDYAALARIDTVVVMMGRESIRRVAESLIAAGRDPRTPAACVEKATSPQQRHVVATLAAIADAVEQAELHTPVVTVIGLVAAHAGTETASLSLPLAGRRVLITRPRGTSRVLERLLLSSGATPIACPLIKIEYPRCNDRLDAAIRQFDRFDWLLFTSQHGVRAFGKRMHACGLDSRALANLKIAAVGPTTAKALRRMGVMADLIPENYHGESMARLLVQNASCGRLRVLYPCSSLTDGRLAETLRRAGASVDAIRAYETTYESPPVALLNVIREGVDVILFFSPSAVGSFARLGLESGDAVAACVGPVTAAAAERVGIEVAVVADDHTSSGLVTALESYFSPVGAGR